MSQSPKLTKQQTLVFEQLARESGPASAYELLDQLRDDGVKAPQQVYRALNKLMEYGLVHRVESLNAFMACAHPHRHTQGIIVFAICDTCGHVAEFSDAAIEQQLARWSEQRAFALRAACVELHGTCASCVTPDPASAGGP